MKTKFAIVLYSTAIVSLVVMTGFVIWRLIIMPPCTQVGSLCIIDSWSVAGLAGTVLAVAATVLAVLGAVAVAAWWSSLNERVSSQVTALVTKFYDEQKAETVAHLQELNRMFQPIEAQTEQIKEEIHEIDLLREALIQDSQLLTTQQSRVEKLTELLEQAVRASQDTLQKLKEKERDVS